MVDGSDSDLSRDCPSRSQLIDFLAGRLADVFIDRIATHVEVCERCSAKLESLETESLESRATAPNALKRAGEFPLDESGGTVVQGLVRQTIEAREGDRLHPEGGSAGMGQAQTNWRELARLGPGATFGSYYLKRVLGEGAVGIVFLALISRVSKTAEETSDRDKSGLSNSTQTESVVLKILKPARLQQADVLRRFAREVKAVTKMQHSNLVGSTGSGVIDDLPYLEMPFLNGESVQELLQRCLYLRPAVAVELVRQAAKGLAYVHAQGWIHRDLKPSNLFVTDAGQVKILDLGLTRFLEGSELLQEENRTDDRLSSNWESTRVTQVGSRMGTRAYMAPEQWVDSANVDHRADIYSLGCVLHMLLTGRHYGEPDEGPARNARTGRWYPNRIDPDLLHLIEDMVALDPAKRIRDASDVVARLESLQQLDPELARFEDRSELLKRENLQYPFPSESKRNSEVITAEDASYQREPNQPNGVQVSQAHYAVSNSQFHSTTIGDQPKRFSGLKALLLGTLLSTSLVIIVVATIAIGSYIVWGSMEAREQAKAANRSNSAGQDQLARMRKTHEDLLSNLPSSTNSPASDPTQANDSFRQGGFPGSQSPTTGLGPPGFRSPSGAGSSFPGPSISSPPRLGPGGSNEARDYADSVHRSMMESMNQMRSYGGDPYGTREPKPIDNTKAFVHLSSGRMSVENSSELLNGAEPLTIECWFRVNSGNSFGRTIIAARRNLASGTPFQSTFAGWSLALEDLGAQHQLVWSQGKTTRRIFIPTNSPRASSRLGSPSKTEWMHVAVIHDQQNYRVLFNGEEVVRSSGWIEDMLRTPRLTLPWENDAQESEHVWEDVQLGATPGDNRFRSFNGDIRELRVSKGDRYQSEQDPPTEFVKDDQTLVLINAIDAEEKKIPNQVGDKYNGILTGGVGVWKASNASTTNAATEGSESAAEDSQADK